MKLTKKSITALTAASLATSALAVSPLITDDADTVPKGEFELVLDFTHERFGGGERENPLAIELVYGIHPQIEFGVGSGWIWNRDDSSVADTVIAAKWKSSADEDPGILFALGAEVKLPTASSSKDLGSGEPDYSLVGIVTFPLGNDTEIDMNVGYTAVDEFKLSSGKDELLLGVAARHQLTDEFAGVGEFIVSTAPDTLSGSELVGRLGFQWEFNDAMFLDFIGFHGMGVSSSFRGVGTALRFEF